MQFIKECGMLSAEDIAEVKVAVEICNNLELKREILCAPGSDYYKNKRDYQYVNKKQWNEIIEKKAAVILKNLSLPEKLKKKVMEVVPAIGMRMLTWAEYHEGTFGFSREYSVTFLKSSFFTQQGKIYNKKAAEELMKDESLSVRQKFKLACLYCFTDHIFALNRQMMNEKFHGAKRKRIRQPELVTFWSYYLMGETSKLGGLEIDQYRLKTAIQSGSKAAVEYCLENIICHPCSIVDAAVEAVRNRIITNDDWIVFRNRRYDGSKESWVPSEYYMDILCFLLSKMREDEQIEFLKKDSRVLEYFLSWPYQDYFMKTAKLMWEFLPEGNYATLLLTVCDKIESIKEINLKYCEEKSYDYRGLLKEFWYQSPERYKRYVLSNRKVTYRDKAGVGLLSKLLTLKNFTHEDRKNIKLILSSATDKEKENIIYSKEWINICIGLIEGKEWEILDRFVLNCFSSEEEAKKFKKELSFTKKAQLACIDFVKNNEWDAPESFIKWCSLPEGDINQLKKEMIDSEDGREACLDLIQCHKGVEDVDRFIRWHFSSGEEEKTFKKELIFSESAVYKCTDLVTEDGLDLVSEFVNLCLSSEKEIRELKKDIAYREGHLVFEKLIADYSIPPEDVLEEQFYYSIGTTKFEGGKWEEVEQFLTWCFSSEEEISDFKKNRLLEVSGVQIHFNLIKYNQWEEAETFFAWLGLSYKETKQLKKDTLFHHYPAGDMFSQLMHSKEGSEEFVAYGSKQEAIELLLRWYLTDKETVIEFKDEFKREWSRAPLTEECKAMIENFDFMIEQRLKDLDKEEMSAKRKSKTFSSKKRLCYLKHENRGIE